jgi:hypothetical protein
LLWQTPLILTNHSKISSPDDQPFESQSLTPFSFFLLITQAPFEYPHLHAVPAPKHYPLQCPFPSTEFGAHGYRNVAIHDCGLCLHHSIECLQLRRHWLFERWVSQIRNANSYAHNSVYYQCDLFSGRCPQ